jgi:hypothetical protein
VKRGIFTPDYFFQPISDPIKSPGTYAEWEAAASGLLRPLVALMGSGTACLPISGAASTSGAAADRLESFARPMLLAAHWLAAEPAEGTLHGGPSRESVAEWFCRALVCGTNPRSAEYWGPSVNAHQNAVEVCVMALALEIARPWLWDPLSRREKDAAARWMESTRALRFYRNNHLFFGVLILGFLQKEGYGRLSDARCVKTWLDILEWMALSGGWFVDGSNETIDYYNAYAFHYYSLWWRLLYAGEETARMKRWEKWTRIFLLDYAHFFSAEGENVPFGRSLIYRFAASAPFALAEKCGISPLPAGMARRICTRNLRFFLSRPILQRQGVLSLGWTDEFPNLMEHYSCAASPYWAAKGMAPLLLPRTSAFWMQPEQPMPAESDFERAIPAAGLVVRATGGAVELFNGGTNISPGNTGFGPWKWGKWSYRTGAGFELGESEGCYPGDAALTAVTMDGMVHGRHGTYCLEATASHMAFTCGLGGVRSPHNIQTESHLWWRGGWVLHFHQVDTRQPTRFQLGTHSLSSGTPEQLTVREEEQICHAANDSLHVGIASLHGFPRTFARRHGGDQGPRTHINSPHSIYLVLETDWLESTACLAAVIWVGRSEPAHPWRLALAENGRWVLSNPAEEQDWIIENDALVELPVAD